MVVHIFIILALICLTILSIAPQSHGHLCLGNMFGNSRYFGLKGTRLNVAVGALAGLDFL